MHNKLRLFLVASQLLFATLAAADISPFSPPFLRAPGDKPSQPSFNYLQYPPPPTPLISDNPAYNAPNDAQPNMHFNLQPDDRNMGPEINHNPNFGDSNVPSGSYPSEYIPANARPSPMHFQHPHAPLSTEGDINVPPVGKIGRPQLRQLDLDSATGRGGDASEVNSASARTRAVNRRGRSNTRVSEGHRLITRALWRIFDALMEKNEKEELHGRMTFIESAIKDMISSDSKLEGFMEMIKEENMGQEQRLEELSRRLGEMQRLTGRVEELETWQLTFERQKDEELQPFVNAPSDWNTKPAYTSCPSPFETVEGECFYVAGETKKTWQDARRDCSNYGGDLAAPQNLESLRTYLQSLAYQPEYVWVGASRQGNGDWVWSVGNMESQLVDMSRDTWNEDLPNGLGNCMGLYEGAAYRAYDYHCREEDLYVCQFFL